ncbi:MAG: hypothetical protein J6P70_03255, partial [Ruminobacter sp.]|nr:hypothetical protein [Ruminobacter sp.]
RMELIHASMSGQLSQYEFDYDDAYARVIQDFTKPVEVTPPEALTGEFTARPEPLCRNLWTVC